MSNKFHNLQLSPIYQVLVDVAEIVRGVAYVYTPNEQFSEMRDIKELQLVYWSEIIQRLHICAVTSIKRLKKWIDSAHGEYVSENYYGFCASLRGLLEAAADSYHALAQVVEPLCDNFSTIEKALRGDATEMRLSGQIENVLIHFIFARKLKQEEKTTFAIEHEAKQVREYIEAFCSDRIRELYSELCQVAHPSAYSLTPFVMQYKEYSIVTHDEHVDGLLNDSILDRYKDEIVSACTIAAMFSMFALLLINKFDVPITDALRTNGNVLKTATNNELWEELTEKMANSKKTDRRVAD